MAPVGRGDRHVVVVEHDDRAGRRGRRRCSSPRRPCRRDMAPSPMTATTLLRARRPDRAPRPCRVRPRSRSRSVPRRTGRARFRCAWRSPLRAALLTDRAQSGVAASGQDLVRIGLMPDVPDDPVAAAYRRRGEAPPSAPRRRDRRRDARRCCETASIRSVRTSSATCRKLELSLQLPQIGRRAGCDREAVSRTLSSSSGISRTGMSWTAASSTCQEQWSHLSRRSRGRAGSGDGI